MPTAIANLQIRVREQELEQLVQQYEAASAQLNRTLAEADKVPIRNQIAHFEAEMTRVAGEIDALKQGRHLPAAVQRPSRTVSYHEIDFVEPWRDLRTIFDDYVDLRDGGGALLLLPDYETLCASLLVQRLRHWLDEKRYGALVYHPVQLLDLEPLSGAQLLRRLGSRLNCDAPVQDGEDLTPYLRRQLDTLVDSLSADQVLLLEINVVPDLYAAEVFVQWFLDAFWTPLLAALKRAAVARPYLRCITLVAADTPMPEPLPLADRYCASGDYCADAVRQFAHLPLGRWEIDDIDRWMRRHSGLYAPGDPQIRMQAESVYARSRHGEPIRVWQNLRNLIEQRAALG
jgi:hypothetical protein